MRRVIVPFDDGGMGRVIVPFDDGGMRRVMFFSVSVINFVSEPNLQPDSKYVLL